MNSLGKPTIFFDRDGTLIEYVEVLTNPEEVKLFPGAVEALSLLKQKGYLVIGVTNQPSIEKGRMTEAQLVAVHTTIQEKLGDGCLDAIYTCPHAYRAEGQCACRKPGVGLIEQAEAQFPIDRSKSFMVGDRLRDIETGKRAGMKTILIPLGVPNDDDTFFLGTTPDYTASDLSGALMFIH
jgi:D-glycero-D-manno-heptose 1,7-bisphosphate phosphatase